MVLNTQAKAPGGPISYVVATEDNEDNECNCLEHIVFSVPKAVPLSPISLSLSSLSPVVVAGDA